ncbi:MFS transporter [uncultured Cohaesibacter sp.]|uniref:MFS transporter n=1 Tax=uncultured Cohaesibacter sp. TaxID=1002546 RepID=UPI0029C9246A|nr:MFS transporter [uncultured Cohaesibacter sp.]
MAEDNIAQDSAVLVDLAARKITRHISAAVALLVVLTSFLVFILTIRAFQEDLQGDLQQTSAQIALSVSNRLEYAADVGIPIDKLRGLEGYFAEVVRDNPQIQSLTLRSPDGTQLAHADLLEEGEEQAVTGGTRNPVLRWAENLLGFFSSEDTSLEESITADGKEYAVLQAYVAKDYINGQFRDILFDMIVTLVVSLLVAFEIMTAFILFHIVNPIRRLIQLVVNGAQGRFDTYVAEKRRDEIGQITRQITDLTMSVHGRFISLLSSIPIGKAGLQDQLDVASRNYHLSSNGPSKLSLGSFVDVRVPLFLFCFADELQKSWLPLYAQSLADDNALLSPEVLVGLPISVYMAVIVLTTPFASRWADQYGTKLMFHLGLVPAVAGYVICAMATDAIMLVAGRGITAFGYSIITIACQGYIAALASQADRGRSMAMFVGVLMSSTMCGTAIGGVLADRVGYQAVFWIAVVLALIAGLLARSMLVAEFDNLKSAKHLSLVRSIPTLMRNTRYLAMCLLAAIPSKILLTGFLFYMVPLYLAEIGSNEAEIGRVMLLYSLTIILIGPFAGRFVDRVGKTGLMLATGGIISVGGLLAFHEWEAVWAVVYMVLIMGIGNSITKSPQIAYALEVSGREVELVGRTTVMGVLRTVERLGSVIGPILAATLVVNFGFQQAILLFGLGLACASVLFYLIVSLSKVEILPEHAGE